MLKQMLIVLTCLGIATTLLAQGAKPAPQPTPQPKWQERKVEVSKLRVVERPATKPPDVRPPKRDGGHWRWHPRYARWCWLPVGVAPRVEILPVDYALPATVTIYEQEPRFITVRCPHCGKPVKVLVPE